MKTPLVLIPLLPILAPSQASLLAPLHPRAAPHDPQGPSDAPCEVLSGYTTTFYGWPDNDPPGTDIAYECPGRKGKAGGNGTYDDPVSFAAKPGEFPKCIILYSAYLRKYIISEDECIGCLDDGHHGNNHIDIWTGSSTSSGGHAQIACEDTLTPETSDFLRNPPKGLQINTEALWDGRCNEGAVFKGVRGSCGGSTQTGPGKGKGG